ncbi:GRB10-interacting GYF protein 2-like [Pecten maximus]|uniref:GRB10-interacting GYF protein 2-like n=1 Tax=Pecten maximus TaxID=6579 RepID=UPI001459088C|nr:GRB10-interacting GYF protein 2-like [Pecten maximus]
MADTLKFGPEWLRALSDGNSLGTPPPSPGFGKYKLADYRYGREEMLALYNPNSKIPEELEGQTYVLVEKTQEPLALIPHSEEEQRLLSQSVNSMAVLRMFGRGGPPGVRGGRGMGPERGRGRGLGRGRGEGGFLQRGTSYEETGGGGFGRSSSHIRTDGWEEVGSKRNYQNRFDEAGAPRREFTRSVSSTDNWRGRDEEEEGDGDWRKAGSSKWGARGNWRDPSNRERGGFDSRPNGVQRGGRTYQRNRNSESWDDEGENLPEWSMPDSDDVEEPGTFDSSGAFVFNKLKGMVRGGKGDHEDIHDRKGAPGFKLREPTMGTDSQQKDDSKEDKSDSESGFSIRNGDEEPGTSVNEYQDKSPHDKTDNKDKSKQGKSNPRTSPQEVERPNSKPQVSDNSRQSNLSTVPASVTKQTSVQNKTAELESSDRSSSAQKQKSAPSTTETKTKSTKKPLSKKEAQMEQEALDRLKEKAENMVLEAIDVEAEEEEEENSQEDESTKKWFYLDPQGDVQGPFASSEMAEWFSAGYFTMNLKVKRGCDDRYSPLGELIKRWGRVPFLPGTAPPPLLNSPQRQASPDLAAQQQQDQIKLLQQQYVLQQHMMHQQMVLRHLQLQQVMTQLQENEEFKNLPPLHQQQLATEILLKQPILPVPGVPTSDPKLSPRSPPTERVGGESPRQMSHTFHRSMSQPADLTKSPPQADDGSIWGGINPAVQDLLSQGTGSVWDLDPKSVISSSDLEAQLEKARKETDERQKEEEEKLRSELFHRKQEELRLQKEEIQREKEMMEMERQKFMKLEEMRQKEEAEKQMREEKEMQRRKVEEERRQMEEKIRRQKEEELRRRKEEEMRLQELHRQQADLRQQELQRQELIRQQEIQRQQEIKRQEEEEMEKQKQLEIQKRQEAQRLQELQHKQQEALRKLQQEQMAKMQLPSHAQWANQQSNAMGASGVSNKTQSLLEIQEQEERERFEQESMQMQQRKADVQRQQMLTLQQQQQQKSWSSQVVPSQGNGKTLLEIQEEQSKQETERKNERQQTQQSQTKNLTLGAASVWGGVTSPSHWASEGAWGNAVRAQTNSQQNSGTSNGAGSLGFWDDAIISSKRAPAASSRNSGGQTNNAEFPALKGGQINTAAPVINTTSKPKPSKMKKEEEAVQKLFQGNIPKGDDFTQWCERELRNMATSVDIPTFISFLKEVDSPYEVHDYVRSYLGENKAAIDFAKQFLEKRSQNRNKSRQQQHQPEDSIWGPAPARDFRQSQPSNQVNDFETQKAKGKKKKKMTKIDSSILGFTVHADPARKNIGEIDNINK